MLGVSRGNLSNLTGFKGDGLTEISETNQLPPVEGDKLLHKDWDTGTKKKMN